MVWRIKSILEGGLEDQEHFDREVPVSRRLLGWGGNLVRENGMKQKQSTTGLTVTRLKRLCQPSRIEHTMHILFALNHWARARERLFFADRQGLYRVKTALLRQAYKSGAIKAVAYIDGIESFGSELMFDIAADIAAESVLWRLETLMVDSTVNIYDQLAKQFYMTMTGKKTLVLSDIEALSDEEVQHYIYAQLVQLEREARSARQPIPHQKLTGLCVGPGDLLYIQDSRLSDLVTWDSWNQLDENDLRKLDPEGTSFIAFDYLSSLSHYVFHLPYRLAEAFLPIDCVEELKRTPVPSSCEQGIYCSRAITDSECLQYPIEELFRELGVNVAEICPHQLSDKQAYLRAQNALYGLRYEDQHFADIDEEMDETLWENINFFTQQSQQQVVKREPNQCPLCFIGVDTEIASARIEHWRQQHAGRDLTYSQATWILRSVLSKEQFCQKYPPDYRLAERKSQRTRYWRLENLVSLPDHRAEIQPSEEEVG